MTKTLRRPPELARRLDARLAREGKPRTRGGREAAERYLAGAQQ